MQFYVIKVILMRTSEKQKFIILWDKTPFPNIVFSEWEAPA